MSVIWGFLGQSFVMYIIFFVEMGDCDPQILKPIRQGKLKLGYKSI